MTIPLRYTMLLVMSLMLATQLNAQSFQKFYNAPVSNSSVYSWDVVQTKDHGFAFTGAGLIVSGTAVGGKAGLWKTDSMGNLQWFKTLDLPFNCNDAYGYAITENADSGFTVAGTCGIELVITRTNSSGDTIWTKRPGYLAGNEIDVNMDRTADNGLIISGSSGFVPSARLLKFDSTGLLQWTKQYNYRQSQRSNDVKEAPAGGYILLCTTGFGIDSAYVVRTDANGDTLWTREWNKTGNAIRMNSITCTADGGFIFTGGNVYGGVIVKLDGSGNEQWWLPTPAYMSHGIYEDTAGHALYSFSWHNSYRLALQKIAEDGSSVLWSKIYGQFVPNYAGDFMQTAGGGFVLNGYGNDGTGNTRAELIKTDAEGNVVTAIDHSNLKLPELTVYPNPSTDRVFVKYAGNADVTVTISNLTGQTLYRSELKGNHASSIDVSTLANGFYFITLNDIKSGKQLVRSFVKQ